MILLALELGERFDETLSKFRTGVVHVEETVDSKRLREERRKN